MSRDERDKVERLQTELVELELGVTELNAQLAEAIHHAREIEADVELRRPEVTRLVDENEGLAVEISRLERFCAPVPPRPQRPSIGEMPVSGWTVSVVLVLIATLVVWWVKVHT